MYGAAMYYIYREIKIWSTFPSRDCHVGVKSGGFLKSHIAYFTLAEIKIENKVYINISCKA